MVLPVDTHKTLRALAALQGRSMNDLVVEAIQHYIESNSGVMDRFVNDWVQRKAGFGRRE
jgi:hypothetical protein